MTNYHPLGQPRSCRHCGEGFPENREALVPAPIDAQGPFNGSMKRMVVWEHPSCANPPVDAFDAWAAANGEPSTTFVDGEEVVDGPATIADFAFAVEVAAGSSIGRLFA